MATSSVGTKKAPIVYLHGGPGAGVVSKQLIADTFAFLADLGHDVYLYDQVGGGLSERLAHITEYTLDRHLADLDAILRGLEAE